MKKIDFGKVAKSYAQSRNDIPITLMDSLLIRNITFQGKKVVDVACGTGVLTRKIAMRRAKVEGIDSSEKLLQYAKAMNAKKNFSIPYHLGTAEDTGLLDSEYEIVTVMRAWHWFDRVKALLEIKRILKANGWFIVIDTGFMIGSPVVEKTMDVLKKYVEGGLQPAGAKADARQRINGFPIEWFEEWSSNGFEVKDFFKLNYKVSFTKKKWIERIESVSWLVNMSEDRRKKALQDLSQSLEDLWSKDEIHSIPHECNVCILRCMSTQKD